MTDRESAFDQFDEDPIEDGEVIDEGSLSDHEEGASPTAEVVGEDDTALGESVDAAMSGIEVALAERDEYLDSLRRLQADFDNFRKRTIRQQAEAGERVVGALIERLLPALDALHLALVHANSDAGAGQDSSGALGQISSLLNDILAKEGLERIDETGVVFDPTIHDAVAHVAPDEDIDGEDLPSGVVVVEVLRAGYELKGRVLRPAMVKVRG